MTREEAIAFFEDMNECTYGNLEAVEMAISALSTEGEYIKKEETLKALHNFWDECIGYDGSGTEMMLDNESVINNLPTYSFPDSAENKGEWIFVLERLPENSDYVLFCDIDNDVMVGYHNPNDQRATHFTEKGSWEDMKNVVAWQPLPKPYKGE